MESLVGAGGWAYFDAGTSDRLSAYARIYPFVEVNSTFYEHPDPRAVARWRRRVPATFRFAVRAHRELTHRYRLRATAAARASLARTAGTARKLDAVSIVLETPETILPDSRELDDLLSSVDLPCPLALEGRMFRDRDLPRPLAAAMEAHDVSDAVDFSRQAPRTVSTTSYGRLFGLGEGNRWEFTDDEMAAIRKRAAGDDRTRVVFAFHGVRMYTDAGRFLTYVRTGSFPRASRHTGLRSLEEVLGEAASFPARRDDLIREHGFRVIDLRAGRTVHASDLLQGLPPGRYAAPSEVVSVLADGESLVPGVGP